MVPAFRHEQCHANGHRAWEYWKGGDRLRSLDLLQRYQPLAGHPDLREFVWHYLWNACHTGSRELRGHEAPILCAAVSPDGQQAASGDRSGAVLI